MSTISLSAAAQAYARDGVAVFPARPRGKQPITAHGMLDATTDPAQVRQWWDATPDANVAVALGPADCWVLDVDGPAGSAALDRLAAVHGALPDTYTVVTGRAEGHGTHLVWQQPTDGGPRVRNGSLGRALDVKGDGGYVIAPPSTHPSGRTYLAQGLWSQVAPAPAWLVGLVRRRQGGGTSPAPPTPPPDPSARHGDAAQVRAASRLHGLCAHLAATAAGGRNAALNHAAHTLGQLVAVGVIDEATVTGALATAAAACGLAGDDGARSVDATIASGLTAGKARPDWSAVDAEAAAPAPTVLHLTPQVEEGFWSARPLLRHVREFARARRCSPWAVLGITLTRIVATIPPHYVLPPIIGGAASLNLFVAVVAPSGGGKGAAESAAADCVDVGEEVRTAGVGSGEGLLHQYVRHVPEHRGKGIAAHVEQHTTSVLFTAGEVDTLHALHQRVASTLMPELRKIYMGEELSFAYVDPAKRLRLSRHAYRAGLVVGVQPARGGVLLDDRDGGTPQRFLWLPGVDPEIPDVAPAAPERWRWTRPHTAAGDPLTGRVTLPVCDAARRTIDVEHVRRNRGHGAALDGHALLGRLKWAAGLAILDERLSVTDDDWALAGVLLEVSDATRGGVVAALAADRGRANAARGQADAERDVIRGEAVAEAAVQRVCRLVMRRLAGGEQARAELRRAVTSTDRGCLDVALDRLATAGKIHVSESVTAYGRPVTTYQAKAVT